MKVTIAIRFCASKNEYGRTFPFPGYWVLGWVFRVSGLIFSSSILSLEGDFQLLQRAQK